MQFHQSNKMPLFSILCIFAFAAEIFASCSVGAKLGVAASAFSYSDRVMDPYIAFDIDLRPYLGYDIKWVQLGEQKPLLAPIVSCFLNYKFTNRFFFRPEVAITQKGVVFNQYDYERIIYEVKMTYLQIPLTLGYQVVHNNRLIVELYAGGAGALKLDAFKKVAYQNSKTQRYYLDNVKNDDFSLLLGFDFKWKVFQNFVLVDVQTFYGLTDIFYPIENQPQLYHRTQKTKNAGFVVSLGYELAK